MGDERPGDVTRERILGVALPLFAEHGFAGTSVRTIAGAADVNVATLAYHFTDKEGLYTACVERLYADLALLDVPLEGDDLLEGVVRAVWTFAKAHRSEIRLLHRHLLDRGRHHEAASDRWLEPLLARAEPVLAVLDPSSTGTERRLLVFSAMHLVVRFVLDDPAQLSRTFGLPEHALDDAIVAWTARIVRGATVGSSR